MPADIMNRSQTGQNGSYGEYSANTVDVDAAIEEYNGMKRELTQMSVHSIKAEEEGRVVEELFDLDQFLQGIKDEDRQIGKKPKQLGLIWKKLEVEGFGADAHTVPTVLTGLLSLAQPWKLLGFGQGGSKKTILHTMSGFVKDGEMLLVLGRPGAGCTTLLKVLSNIRSPYTKVDGDVSYGGINPVTFFKHYRGQVIYNDEEDQHYPTLTVRETLEFSLRTKTPGNRLPNETKSEFIEKIIFMLGNMLGLSKKMNTTVGNGVIRGLSGGERKRLSIAEAMTTQSSINIWDCATRGLDAVSALDYVRSLRIMTDIQHKTTVSALYQASNTIFSLYDKVVLLDKGYCIYFGPVKQAKGYFEELGFYCPDRKSTPDFLTGICNPLEREVKPGYTVPETAAEMQQRYVESAVYKEMMAELQEYEDKINGEKGAELFKEAVHEEHQKYAPRMHPYTASFYQQVKALTIRQFQLLSKRYDSLISRYGTIVILSFLFGSSFYDSPLTGAGATSRAGAICFTIIFVTFVSHSELVDFMTGRPILEKQKHFAMYRPSAFYLAQLVVDIPITILQVFLYQIPFYFLVGLTLDAGRFFSFSVILFMTSFSANGFFRFFGVITNNFVVANLATSVIFIDFLLYFGYHIKYGSMHPWFVWVHWIDPFAYGFKALLINEMKGQVYSCEGPGNSIPYGSGYDSWEHKICSMRGGNPGENFVLGDDYLRQELNFEPSWLWAPNFVMVVGWFLFFTIVNLFIVEYLHINGGGSLTKLYLNGKAPKPRTAEEERQRLERQQKVTQEMDKASTGTTFSWQNVNYAVPFKGETLPLLNNISGIIEPGHLTALMGASGAGKTTLLDVLARRKTMGKVDGRIYLNNEALIADFERITGYCEQTDIHQPAVTVREGLQFSAYLRQDANVPKAEKDAYVEQIIQLLEMDDIADAQIGELEQGSGISIEERKRLTIGMELVAKPKLIFLDEPTSGLDAQSSYNIVRFLRKLADAGWPVLCTIHQPSSILFEHFDHLLLMVHGGRMAYHGEIGPGARTVVNYFESNGAPRCASDVNHAEYILEVVSGGASMGTTQDWATIWSNSKEAKALDDELEAIHNTVDMNPTRKALAYASSFWTQLFLVYKRLTLVYWRSSGYNLGRLITIALLALFLGFTSWKLTLTSLDMENRVLSQFFVGPFGYMMIVMAQPKFMTERLYFRREYASRYYGWVPFAISSILVEVPYILFLCALYMCSVYWTVGFVNTSEASGYYYLLLMAFIFWSVTFGFILGGLTENPFVAAILNPLLNAFILGFAGTMQPESSLPHFWSSWMYWADLFHYVAEGLAVSEMKNLPVICNDNDLFKFSPPANQTCGEYMENFFTTGGSGYIVDNSSTVQCEYCSYKTGEEYYSSTYGWSASHQWRNLGIIYVFVVFNMFVFSALVYFRRKARR
ncbi:ABC-2 type transporter-domain-containing protein [Fennellomyces sp. T-0311]|nr:ABC-2 type transporter-domain-containing protein [Fennellomyces sp. T-0311]